MITLTDLGYLLWWKVGDVNIDHDQLGTALEGTGITPPARPIPIDVYRRVTGSTRQTYDLSPEHTLELTTHPVDNPSDKMLARHMVATVKDQAGVTQVIRKVGDVAFYKPPRGKNSKARMRVTAQAPVEEWSMPVQVYTNLLQTEYEHGVKGKLDGQAVRRLVRAHLANQGAVFVDGPYYIEHDKMPAVVNGLTPLFELLGEDSYFHDVPVSDEGRLRKFLARVKDE